MYPIPPSLFACPLPFLSSSSEWSRRNDRAHARQHMLVHLRLSLRIYTKRARARAHMCTRNTCAGTSANSMDRYVHRGTGKVFFLSCLLACLLASKFFSFPVVLKSKENQLGDLPETWWAKLIHGQFSFLLLSPN